MQSHACSYPYIRPTRTPSKHNISHDDSVSFLPIEPMKISSIIVVALLLIASNLIIFSSLSVCHGREIPIDRSSSTGSTINSAATFHVHPCGSKKPMKGDDKSGDEPKKAVVTSLRKAPPSIPNPTQNK